MAHFDKLYYWNLEEHDVHDWGSDMDPEQMKLIMVAGMSA